MGRLRKIASEPEARRSLAGVRASGLTIREWARARGIDGRSLHAWQVNLARASTAGAGKRSRSSVVLSSRTAVPARLVEVVPAPVMSSPRYVVKIDGASVEVDDDFEADTLRRIIEVLRSC